MFLDDGTARRRCLVDSRLVEKWLGGKGPADIAPYDDSDPRRAELLAPVRSLLQKAEGMWRLEIRGGGAGPSQLIALPLRFSPVIFLPLLFLILLFLLPLLFLFLLLLLLLFLFLFLLLFLFLFLLLLLLTSLPCLLPSIPFPSPARNYNFLLRLSDSSAE